VDTRLRPRHLQRDHALDLVAVARCEPMQPAEPLAGGVPEAIGRADVVEPVLGDCRDSANHLDRRLAIEQHALDERGLDHESVRVLAPLVHGAAGPDDVEAWHSVFPVAAPQR
jgi:hypothetical protein